MAHPAEALPPSSRRRGDDPRFVLIGSGILVILVVSMVAKLLLTGSDGELEAHNVDHRVMQIPIEVSD